MKFIQNYVSKMYIRHASSSCRGTKLWIGINVVIVSLCTSVFMGETSMCSLRLEEALAEEIVEDFEWWLSCVEADCFCNMAQKVGLWFYSDLFIIKIQSKTRCIFCNSSENSNCFRRYMQVIFVNIILHMNNSLLKYCYYL